MILIIDCGSSKVPFIEEQVDYHSDYRTVPILDLSESDLNNVNGVIISGAPLLITELDMSAYLERVRWIKTTDIPVLGICFGHQLIGLLFGAEPSRSREVRDWQTISFNEDSLLSDKLPMEVEMMEDHCETISIPQDFKLLASSDSCINETMKHREREIYGVQFHPEVSGNHGAVLTGNFVQHCINSQ